MKTSKGKALLYLVVLQSGLAGATEEVPKPSVEMRQSVSCFQTSSELGRHNCLGFGFSYRISQNMSVQVYTGVNPNGFGVRYWYNEFTFAELRFNRSGDFFSLILSHEF